ncbi:BON domain-containing protein [Desulfovibrio gilichinskyi]|uniref:Osmotically-inducible protein OsmY, contains BON domain n=1 Tax=Desulfovibrio gilichinskyi TaxID=1519643 RepID=A0A1X7CWP4_9BACT|nr:BON domain-containing protein [Desulfovibrio gilichinskyi]SMF04197.1 Osmotically-inducible protein OsmY, contains BON domain [Desulfovibrio gilichinskyi]
MNKILSSISLVLLFSLSLNCTFHESTAHAGFLPFGRMYKAAKDDRAYVVQASDTRLQLQLHKAILAENPSDILAISTFVYLGHGFLVGEVSSEEQSRSLVDAAKNVSGLNGISYYLPLKKNGENYETSSAFEIKIKGMLEPDYPSSKLTVKVVQNVVVALGVLTEQEQEKALNSLKNFNGVAKVINFIQSPSGAESKRDRPRPLRNFLN